VNPSDRRRSDRFAELLDERAGGRRSHRHNAEDEKLAASVGLAGRVAALPDVPGPTDEFRVGLRAVLVSKIERDGVDAALSHDSTVRISSREVGQALAGQAQPRRRPSRTSRLRLVLLGGVTVGAVALSGVSAASSDSLPGDALYQVKRSTEQAQLALAGSDQGRGSLHLDFARLRLREATQIDPALVGAALTDMNREITTGVELITASAGQRKDPSGLAVLTTFVEQQQAQLAAAHAALATAGRTAGDLVATSQALLNRVKTRADALTRAITRGCTLDGKDDLGPYAKAC
jgi:hypothetical protein